MFLATGIKIYFKEVAGWPEGEAGGSGDNNPGSSLNGYHGFSASHAVML